MVAPILVMALVGHLWMQSSHDVSGADDHAAAASAQHGGHDDGQAPSNDHTSPCPALPSADYRVAPQLHCLAVTPAVHPWVIGEDARETVERHVGRQRRPPRSPGDGVVLVL